MEREYWHGVPLQEVRTARFITLAGAFNTMRRLITNGKEHVFTTDEDGAVLLNDTYTSWKFIAPTDAFPVGYLLQGAISDMLDAVIAYCSSHTVSAWEDFSNWLSNEKYSSHISDMMGNIQGGAAWAPRSSEHYAIEELPEWSATGRFADFVSWVKGALPEGLLSESASVMEEEDGSAELTCYMKLGISGYGDTLLTVSFRV